jgi:hypothetical protein
MKITKSLLSSALFFPLSKRITKLIHHHHHARRKKSKTEGIFLERNLKKKTKKTKTKKK